ncbi:serrate RNA effector molecule [Zea mays]|nr:serrate RNA effector molecule [Zea mays]AQK51362.1 Putative SERRATE-related C2H2 zinc-finger family protein [Zea mays]|eukprot:NP_001292800.1 serrate RNA effector molecule [Zea mays]
MTEVADASPPPPTAGGGDRKRGRASPVPPLPGQHKRRREEGGGGGFDRRRLGPVGGGGHEQDDRRYGNGLGGIGGRGGDSRYTNRAPDSGRGGWNEGSGNSRREGLMSYKQFIQELEDDVSPVEAQSRYEEYKSEYITTQKKAYFALHKDEDWLRNKYHPTNLENVIERRNELARTTADDFFLQLQSGSLDTGPGLTGSAVSKSGNNSSKNLDAVEGDGKKGKLGKGSDDSYYAAPKAHPVSSEVRRIRIDIEQAQGLICKLDSEKGIENNILSSSNHEKPDMDKSHGSMGPIVIVQGSSTVKGLEGTELLDTLVTYLWRIHGVDYYGMSETNEPKGLRHVKADARTYNGASSSATEWENKLDSFWQDRIQGQDPLEILKAKEKIDGAATEVLDPYVRKIRDEKYGWKYGCGAKGCTKLFHAAEFVQKHIKLKHTDLVVDLTSKAREDIYFENYMNDPKAPGGTPIMQQPAPRGKGRQRPPIESRLRDERGNHRLDSDGSGENPDDPVYDSFGDPTMHGAFPPDIPAPPVLMPVPGAGPLGPFIPAPPEVAMHMLRDQGAPPPFEPSGGPHPRKAGRGSGGGGPPMRGPSPVFSAPPPHHMHDPRRIRSYQDLDAPEDEVTVMDYRSL